MEIKNGVDIHELYVFLLIVFPFLSVNFYKQPSNLEGAFGLKITLQKADVTKQGIQQYRLYFPTSCYFQMKEFIYDYLLPSLLYKFPAES